MSTFLELCKKTHELVGAGEGAPGTVPTTVTGQVENLAKVVNRVVDAWHLLQAKRGDWQWMMATGTIDTSAGVQDYTPSGTLTRYETVRPRVAQRGGDKYITAYNVSVGATDDQPITFVEPVDFEGFYDSTAWTQQARPVWFTIRPNGDLSFYPIPDAVYRVKLPYRKSRQTLSADADVPEMPAKFHNLIAYQAQRLFGAESENTRNFSVGQQLFDELYNELVREQTPRVVGPY